MEIIRTNPEAAIALAALVVSVFAVISNIIALYMQRAHNIRSLRPNLTFICTDQNDRIRVQIKNIGLGPALITKQVLLKNETVVEENAFVDLMPKLDLVNGRPAWTIFANSLVNEKLGAGSARNLIEFSGEIALAHQDWVMEIRRALAVSEVEFHYKDSYEITYQERSNIRAKYKKHL